MKTDNFIIDDVKKELQKRIANINRYNLSYEFSSNILYIKCLGVGVEGCEADVDISGKSFAEVINELVPKLTRLIHKCKEKSPCET